MDYYGLTVEVRQEPGHMLITVAGEVDIATTPQLRARLAGPAASGMPIIVDLDPVSFIDATGLGVLASAASRTAAHGAGLQVVCARHQVRRLFTITGLDRHIPLARTMAQACHNLAAARSVPVNGHRAGDDQGGVAALDAHGLDVSAGCLGHPQPVQGQQRDQRVVGGRPEAGGDEQGTELVRSSAVACDS